MRRLYKLRIALFTVLIICSCGYFSTLVQERSFTTGTQYYSFEPATILLSIDKGEEALTRLSDDADPTLSYGEFVLWSQDDYVNILRHIYASALGSRLDKWALQEIRFIKSCVKIDPGFQGAMFTHFQVDVFNQRRNVRIIHIQPDLHAISVFNEASVPSGRIEVLERWQDIDLAGMQVDAGQAFQIAELNGGEEFRIQQNEECFVSIRNSAELDENGWLFSYLNSLDGMKFKINIDDQTGHFVTLED